MFVSRTTELAWHVINKKEIKFQGPDSSRKEGRLATTRTDLFGGLPSSTFTKLLTAKAFLNFGKFGQFRTAVDAAGRADHCPPYHAIGLLRAALSRPIGGGHQFLVLLHARQLSSRGFALTQHVDASVERTTCPRPLNEVCGMHRPMQDPLEDAKSFTDHPDSSTL